MDLFEPVIEQLKIVQANNLPATWLFQYDAFINPEFVSIFDNAGSDQEIGLWLEIVQPMVEKAGLKWRGRWGWDWFPDVGFTVGYDKQQREKLIDVCFAEFENVFGYFPESVGSWVLDAHSMEYMSNKYGVKAFCVCKEQSGTDGYTLWGGYYNHAYYPSKNNALLPACEKRNQINTPVFRMLGADPIYQYNADTYDCEGQDAQRVHTLEPVSGGCGDNKDWINWYFDINESQNTYPFGYIQIGQENSFGWDVIKTGFTLQIEVLMERVKDGKVEAQTLAQSGKWFRKQFGVSPAITFSALDDYKKQNFKSVWFYSRYYRINIVSDGSQIFIRDLMLYSDELKEKYIDGVCNSPHCQFRALPIVEGSLYDEDCGRIKLPVKLISDSLNITHNEDAKLLTWDTADCRKFTVKLLEDSIEFYSDDKDWSLTYLIGENKSLLNNVLSDSLLFSQDEFEYRLNLSEGLFVKKNSVISLTTEGCRLVVNLKD
ncbi:MAG: hypothetical protein ACIAQZ_15885 [Sedimentisphaeraceae bacterium JB056]